MNEYQELFESVNGHRIVGTLLRKPMCAKYAWAVPNDKAIDLICKYSPLIEMGAGTGYWGKLIKERRGEIICFDKYPNGNNEYGHHKHWIDVYEGDESILDRFSPKMNLFLCWPPYEDNMAINCLKQFKGRYLIYIGESYLGMNANKVFFDELKVNWKKVEYEWIPTWESIHDCLTIYRRKSK